MTEKPSQKPIKVRDIRKRGWFHIDSDFLNKGYGNKLGPIGISVYISICKHANNLTQSCYPSQERIADEIGVAKRTIVTYIKKLKELQIIEVEREKKGRKWVSNVYFIRDKSDWKKLSGATNASDKKNDQVQEVHLSGANDDTHQVHPNHPNYTNNNYTNRTTLAKKKTFLRGKEWNDLIDEFKNVNPLYEEFYKNKTERSALDFIAKKMGTKKTKDIIGFLQKSNSHKFAPKITKPTELKRSLGKLIAWASTQKSKGKKVVSV